MMKDRARCETWPICYLSYKIFMHAPQIGRVGVNLSLTDNDGNKSRVESADQAQTFLYFVLKPVHHFITKKRNVAAHSVFPWKFNIDK